MQRQNTIASKTLGVMLAIGASGLWSATAVMAGPVPFFQGLGDLPGGSFSSQASGVSADGSVVVGKGTSASHGEAFRWTAGGGMIGLGDLPGGNSFSAALDVSADGSVVVGQSGSASGLEAFRWTADGGMVGLGDLPGGGFQSIANGVSADGLVVVGQGSSASGLEAFRWTAGGGMVGLGDLPGSDFFSEAIATSADGAVVVGLSISLSASGGEAFRWTASGGMVGLGHLPGMASSSACATSADGSVVVGNSKSAFGGISEAFRWTAGGGMVGLGDLPGGGLFSEAIATSADGSVVVGSGNSDSGDEAFIWDALNGMRNLQNVLVTDLGLDLTGWQLFNACGVSADGLTIVGWGNNPEGFIEAWIATIPKLCVCLGSFNGDIVRNGEDIQYFIDCLTATGNNCACADLDGNAVLDINDVAVFINDLLIAPDCP